MTFYSFSLVGAVIPLTSIGQIFLYPHKKVCISSIRDVPPIISILIRTKLVVNLSAQLI